LSLLSSFSSADCRKNEATHAVKAPRGFGGLAKGREQTITFPLAGNLKADSGPVKLKATSDAGLPVEYYVAYGPARIEDGALRIAEIPARNIPSK